MPKRSGPGEIRYFTSYAPGHEYTTGAGDATVVQETNAGVHPDTTAGSINQRNSVAESNGDENSPFVKGVA